MNDLTLPGPGEASGKGATSALAQLPAVDRLLNHATLAALAAAQGSALVKRAVQEELSAQRERLKAGADLPALDAMVASIATRVAQRAAPRLTRVINLSGPKISRPFFHQK